MKQMLLVGLTFATLMHKYFKAQPYSRTNVVLVGLTFAKLTQSPNSFKIIPISSRTPLMLKFENEMKSTEYFC